MNYFTSTCTYSMMIRQALELVEMRALELQMNALKNKVQVWNSPYFQFALVHAQ